MNWLSVIILAVIVLFVFNGVKRGMIRSAFSLISVILTLLLGTALNPYMTKFLTENTPIYHTVQKKCEESLLENLQDAFEEQWTKEEENQFITNLPLPENVIRILTENNNSEHYQQVLAQTFGEYLSHSIAKIAVSSISMICSFILISIFMNLIAGMLDVIFSLPVLSFLNRIGGAVLGMVQGVFFVWVCFLVITLFWDAGWAKEAVALIRENEITGLLYEHNILLYFLSGIL